MSGGKLANYIRTHRKRSGLSQRDIAAILGLRCPGAISRYEWSQHLPSLPVALAFEILFRVPVSQIFAGVCETIGDATEEKLQELETKLQGRPGTGPTAAFTAKKLVWLTERKLGSGE